MPKRVIARLLINEASIETFIPLAEALVDSSRREEGNLSYHLYQNLEKKSAFLFIETYKDQEALDYHFNALHLKEFLTTVTPILQQQPSIEIDQPE